jgi:amino acid transporter
MGFANSRHNQNKKLGVFGLTMINVIAIDSLRNLPINAEYGFTLVGLYLIGAIAFFLPCILITAELATHFPETGGSYVWVKKAFGPRAGFINSWMQWIYNVVWFPTILTFIASTIGYLFFPSLVENKLYLLSCVIGLFFLATTANIFGIHLASWVSTLGALLGTIIPMALISILGITWLIGKHPLATTFNWQHLFPNIHHLGDMAFLVVILYSLVGIEMSAIHAGDVHNPKRDFPRALFCSALIILTTMILASLAIAAVLPKTSINIVSGLNDAFYAFLHAFGLEAYLPIAILCIVIGAFASIAAWVLGPTRALMIAGQDGCAPKLFAKSNKHGAPTTLLVLQLVIVILLCGLFSLFDSISAAYWVLSDLTAQLALIYYIIFFASGIALKKQVLQMPRGFRIKGGITGTACVAGLGILCCITAILIGFFPPQSVAIKSPIKYDLTLLIGGAIFVLLPWLISKKTQEKPL